MIVLIILSALAFLTYHTLCDCAWRHRKATLGGILPPEMVHQIPDEAWTIKEVDHSEIIPISTETVGGIVSRCCAYDCDFKDAYPNQPCWGTISVIDQLGEEAEWSWVHACTGHEPVWEGKDYLPQPKDIQ